ncbi:MAG: hypothetical protein ABSF22_16670 [Bryobacteraceae bacterium]
MQLSDIFLGLGEDTFQQLMRSVSMGRLRTYQLFDRIKTRLHLHKLSSETLRKASPRLFERLKERDEDYATDLAQAILVSHLEMIKAVLDHLGVPHEDGFFQKDADVSGFLKEGWQHEVWTKFQTTYSPAALLFYINHLAWEVSKAETVFTPNDVAASRG